MRPLKSLRMSKQHEAGARRLPTTLARHFRRCLQGGTFSANV
jgi:hypothetical protein